MQLRFQQFYKKKLHTKEYKFLIVILSPMTGQISLARFASYRNVAQNSFYPSESNPRTAVYAV